ncbi:hypothetical protein H8356DRAFT_1331907 [Neocallimastix lanati (nom. inval.)]|nr:hypothetical protein H8356DRAFT_1331907 [Neocallimastix sp. JGI-2020a]
MSIHLFKKLQCGISPELRITNLGHHETKFRKTAFSELSNISKHHDTVTWFNIYNRNYTIIVLCSQDLQITTINQYLCQTTGKMMKLVYTINNNMIEVVATLRNRELIIQVYLRLPSFYPFKLGLSFTDVIFTIPIFRIPTFVAYYVKQTSTITYAIIHICLNYQIRGSILYNYFINIKILMLKQIVKAKFRTQNYHKNTKIQFFNPLQGKPLETPFKGNHTNTNITNITFKSIIIKVYVKHRFKGFSNVFCVNE